MGLLRMLIISYIIIFIGAYFGLVAVLVYARNVVILTSKYVL